jgi:hypothetical protein
MIGIINVEIPKGHCHKAPEHRLNPIIYSIFLSEFELKNWVECGKLGQLLNCPFLAIRNVKETADFENRDDEVFLKVIQGISSWHVNLNPQSDNVVF